ncbi:CARDB domain-containing protein [Candidatus Methanodesulfokora washburnensis]|jgi:hypothetical protein|uniref:Big-1 domain-containing protein n=1 Tax=Candidatus Methanodesulfokora washburnensis TaxID=2478471 RepID=A0A429GCW2_9CREN|nr:CARDB domain-containing protein [Candidatus Methanodesulfokores washburnensis]RSN71657.1 hypothetical protein D6D85_15555 [Candidatus Methanodesulfokores washburnensis]
MYRRLLNLCVILLAILLISSTFEGFLASSFAIGDLVEVQNCSSYGKPLNVRDAPAGKVIGTKNDGARGTIIDGPVAASLNGITYTWWKIRWEDGLVGWSAEGYPGGVYYLKKVSSEAPKPSPVINSVTSGLTASSSRQKVDIYGSGFQYGASLGLWDPSGTLITDHSEYFVDSTYIYFYATLSVAGSWKVQVINPDGQRSNQYIFQVTYPPIVETAPGASSGQGQIQVTGGKPDLTVEGVSVDKTKVSIGDSLTVTFSIKNVGNAASGTFRYRISLSPYMYGSTYPMNYFYDSLEAGQSKILTKTVTIPSVPEGYYYVTVYVDDNGAISESNEDNNIGSTGAPGGQEQIYVQSSGVNPLPYTTPQKVTLTLYVHEESKDGPLLSGVRVAGYDGAGKSFDQTTDGGYVVIEGTPGKWHFTISKEGYKDVIWDQYITEACTKHAYFTEKIKVTYPPTPTPMLTFTSLEPSTIETSESTYYANLIATGTNFYNVVQITFTWSGPDSGTATWCKGDSNWNAGVTVNSDTSMTLRPRVLYQESGTQQKTWNWIVTLKDNTGATASRQFTVIYKSPTPTSTTAPQVTGVSPSRLTASPSRQWISVIGNNFVSGATVTLQIGSNIYSIPQDRTRLVGSTQIDVFVGLTDPGTWKVWVTNPDGQKSNIFSFTVETSQKVQTPSSNLIPGKDVPTKAPDFFQRVLTKIGISTSDFAIQALIIWTRYENTNAYWNPLATTWSMGEKSWNFNSAGVKNYGDEGTGVQATANTLALSYYGPIRDMLALRSFDEQALRRAVAKWSGLDPSSSYVIGLVNEWRSIYPQAPSVPSSPQKDATTMPSQCRNNPQYISMDDAARYALDAGFNEDEAVKIVAIAWAESSGNIYACNANKENGIIWSWDRGILQINSHSHGEGTPIPVTDEQAFNPAEAFKQAYRIYKERGFEEWEAFNKGTWKTYENDAKKAVDKVIAQIVQPVTSTPTSPSAISNVTLTPTPSQQAPLPPLQAPQTIPNVPILISPDNGETMTTRTITFTWSKVPGATSYLIEIDGPTSKLEIVPTASYTTTLAPGSYIWRVKAHNDVGWSDWTQIRSFTITVPLSVQMTAKPSKITTSQISTIMVTVTSDGNPVSGASVSLSTTGGSLTKTSGVTDSNGQFTSAFSSSVTGSFTITARVSKPGYTGLGSTQIVVSPLSVFKLASYNVWYSTEGKVFASVTVENLDNVKREINIALAIQDPEGNSHSAKEYKTISLEPRGSQSITLSLDIPMIIGDYKAKITIWTYGPHKTESRELTFSVAAASSYDQQSLAIANKWKNARLVSIPKEEFYKNFDKIKKSLISSEEEITVGWDVIKEWAVYGIEEALPIPVPEEYIRAFVEGRFKEIPSKDRALIEAGLLGIKKLGEKRFESVLKKVLTKEMAKKLLKESAKAQGMSEEIAEKTSMKLAEVLVAKEAAKRALILTKAIFAAIDTKEPLDKTFDWAFGSSRVRLREITNILKLGYLTTETQNHVNFIIREEQGGFVIYLVSYEYYYSEPLYTSSPKIDGAPRKVIQYEIGTYNQIPPIFEGGS